MQPKFLQGSLSGRVGIMPLYNESLDLVALHLNKVAV